MPDLKIEIVHALPHRQIIVQVAVARGSTVGDAVERSGILRRIAPDEAHGYGIFGRRVTAERQLEDGDRIEIYRPLRTDPRTARRTRAKPWRARRR